MVDRSDPNHFVLPESPKGVGIHGMEVYFPRFAVKQSELEKYMVAGEGKFTIGKKITRIELAQTQNLLEKYNVAPTDIGRLEVGTETLIDKSKSVKSTLTRLLHEHGNFDVEGVDNINACYGGTAALLNTMAWVESSAWDGRYGLVVCGDIAVYEAGPARPTGGCAAVAMLIGRDSPIVLGSVRASHMEDAYDFYKPNLSSEYPTVFGQESNVCYLRALDGCYRRFAQKYETATKKKFDLDSVDHVVLHSPYNKLVKKSGARMLYNDYLRNHNLPLFKKNEGLLDKFRTLMPEDTYNNRELEAAFTELARPMYASKVEPSVLLPQELGNSYTASMYTGLLSLIHNWHKPKPGAQVDTEAAVKDKKVLMFSYGSGLAATMYYLKINGNTGHIAAAANLEERLEERKFVPPEEFSNILKDRETKYGKFDWSPQSDPSDLFPGTYYLKNVDAHGRRSYSRVPVSPFRTTINYGYHAFHASKGRAMHTGVRRIASPSVPAASSAALRVSRSMVQMLRRVPI